MAVESTYFQQTQNGVDSRFWIGLLGILVLAICVCLIFFRGMFPSDDLVYFIRALELSKNIWSSSDYVGAIRYGVNIPIGFAIVLFGSNLSAATLVPLVCSLLEIAIIAIVVHREWGRGTALVAALVLCFTPLHIESATSVHADPILAFATTLTFALFWAGERSGDPRVYFLAGVSAGLMYWTKEASVLCFLVFPIYALVVRRWSWAWLYAACGAVLMFALNCMLMWSVSGDPLHVVMVTRSTVSSGWTSSGVADAPWFYFWYLFLDLRHTWLAGYLALAGGIYFVIVRHRLSPRERRFSVYVAVWLLGILALLSFIPVSSTPLRFVMKQSNYMTLFLAPLAIMAAFGLAQMNPRTRIVVTVLFVLGGSILAALAQQATRAFVGNAQALEAFAAAHPRDLVYGTTWDVHTSEYHARLKSLTEEPHVREISTLRYNSNWGEEQTIFVVIDRETLGRSPSDVHLPQIPSCWVRSGELLPIGFGVGAVVTKTIISTMNTLPSPLRKNISPPFERLLHPAPAEIYVVPKSNPWC